MSAADAAAFKRCLMQLWQSLDDVAANYAKAFELRQAVDRHDYVAVSSMLSTGEYNVNSFSDGSKEGYRGQVLHLEACLNKVGELLTAYPGDKSAAAPLIDISGCNTLENFISEFEARNRGAQDQPHRANHLVAISNPHELNLLEACIHQVSNLLDAGDVEHDFDGHLICYEEMTHLEVRTAAHRRPSNQEYQWYLVHISLF